MSALATQTRLSPTDVHSFARDLANKLTGEGYSYGNAGEGKKTVNCVDFTQLVVKDIFAKAGYNLSRSDIDQIQLNLGGERYADHVNGFRGEGAAGLLVQKGLADYVRDKKELKKGDVIQYHWQAADGSWRGHCGVISNVTEKGIELISSHSSPCKIGPTFVPWGEIQKFTAAQVRSAAGSERAGINLPPALPSQPPVGGASSLDTTSESKFSQIRRGDSQAYVREGSRGSEVLKLKSDLLDALQRLGKLSADELKKLKSSVGEDTMSGEWVAAVTKFQNSVGLDLLTGKLNKNPKHGEQLAADGVWGIRSQRALDLALGRENTPEFQAVSWDEFQRITGGVWTQAQMEEAGIGSSDESISFQGNIDVSGLTPSQRRKRPVADVQIEPQMLIQRGWARNFNEAKNIIAFLATISVHEGTASEKGYGTMFGGRWFDNERNKHPDSVQRANGLASAAAGKYQFMPDTAKSVGLTGVMTALAQDEAAIRLLERRGILGRIRAGDFVGALPNASFEWASLPSGRGDSGGRYGQFGDSGRFAKVMRDIAQFQRGVDEVYSQTGAAEGRSVPQVA